jgi:hypothetical protein
MIVHLFGGVQNCHEMVHYVAAAQLTPCLVQLTPNLAP